jgi:large subunit ribosomal protein L24
MLVCPSCDEKTRVGFDIKDDGYKTRVCKKCGEDID